MRIGGLLKFSLIDYPGKVAAVVFTQGCNYRCPFCHNPELVLPELFVDPLSENDVLDFLEKRKGQLQGVVVTGGEPSIHNDLPEFLQKIKALGFLVKLDTNGSNPGVLKGLIERHLVDYIAMDIKTVPEHYPQHIQKNCDTGALTSSIQLIKTSGLSHEFRTTCIKPLIDQHIVERICEMIQGADLYVLQRFRLSHVLNPDFFRENDYRIAENELQTYQAIAEKWVTSCMIR